MLRFYSPVNPVGLCRAQSVYLTTLLQGRLSPLRGIPVLCRFFRQKLTTAFLNQQKGENDCRKCFMINIHERMLQTRQGSNPQPPHHPSDRHPTEPPRPALSGAMFIYILTTAKQRRSLPDCMAIPFLHTEKWVVFPARAPSRLNQQTTFY